MDKKEVTTGHSSQVSLIVTRTEGLMGKSPFYLSHVGLRERESGESVIKGVCMCVSILLVKVV